MPCTPRWKWTAGLTLEFKPPCSRSSSPVLRSHDLYYHRTGIVPLHPHPSPVLVWPFCFHLFIFFSHSYMYVSSLPNLLPAIITREMQIKTTMRKKKEETNKKIKTKKQKLPWDITSHWSEWPSSKNLQAINAGEGMGKRELFCTVWGNIN